MSILLAQEAFDWRSPLSNAFESIVTFIPKLLAFLLILLVTWIVAKLLKKATHWLLQKINFDSLMDRAGIGRPLSRGGFDDSSNFVALIVYYAVWLLGLQLAIGVFGPNPISDLINSVVAFIPRAVVALIIIIVTGLLVRAVNQMLQPFYSNMDWGRLARGIVTGAIWLIGIFAALDQIQVAEDIVNTLFTTIVGSLGFILAIKFGVGGIWAARDRFWPAVYDKIDGTDTGDASPASPSSGGGDKKTETVIKPADPSDRPSEPLA